MSTRPSRLSPSNSGSILRLGAALVVASLGLVAFAPGCGPGDKNEYRCDSSGCFECDGYGCKPVPTPSIQPCSYAGDSTCKAGTVCTELGCLAPCKADSECEKGLLCKNSFCTPPGSEPTEPKECGTAADCSALGDGALCVDGKCAKAPACEGASCACKYSSDCGEGRICVDSKCEKACGPGVAECAAGDTCGDKGFCVPGAPTCGPAAGDKACPSGELCVDGHCKKGCASDDQCLGPDGKPDATQRCVAGACIPDERTDPKCSGDAQCDAGLQKCVDGFCKYTCTTDDACKAIDSRIGACSPTENICRAPEEIAAKCTSKADCEAGKSCVDGQCK